MGRGQTTAICRLRRECVIPPGRGVRLSSPSCDLQAGAGGSSRACVGFGKIRRMAVPQLWGRPSPCLHRVLSTHRAVAATRPRCDGQPQCPAAPAGVAVVLSVIDLSREAPDAIRDFGLLGGQRTSHSPELRPLAAGSAALRWLYWSRSMQLIPPDSCALGALGALGFLAAVGLIK